jgi:hypothetical protein
MNSLKVLCILTCSEKFVPVLAAGLGIKAYRARDLSVNHAPLEFPCAVQCSTPAEWKEVEKLFGVSTPLVNVEVELLVPTNYPHYPVA